MEWPGADDLRAAADELAGRVPAALRPLARVAYNYRWTWQPGGPELFASLDPHRWEMCGQNPVRQLREADPELLARAAEDGALVARAEAAEALVRAEADRPPASGFTADRPIAFFCSEFGVHVSLPLYAGGLGVLAGDLLKQASDAALPMVGVGLFYRYGYFHQRADLSGLQHEFWVELDSRRMPVVRVTRDGRPVEIRTGLWGQPVRLQIWRADIGAVPLYLLDAEVAGNDPVQRWLTARLYDGNRTIRLGQYAMLGMGGVRALAELGIQPAAYHLNEGHAALAGLELAAREVAGGADFASAFAATRKRIVFTTHTPVPAGNESYTAEQVATGLPDLPARLGIEAPALLDLGRAHPGDSREGLGLTPLAIRSSRRTNGVSMRHGEVARQMWEGVAHTPIGAITNGVHLPTWMGPAFRELFERYLGAGWEARAADPALWEVVDRISDAELWTARNRARARLIGVARARSLTDRLRRGEPIEYVRAAASALHPARLTIGFARRLASYKRLGLLVHDPPRALKLLDEPNPLQLLFAGKAHPSDEAAKRIVQAMFMLKRAEHVAERVVFLEDYDLELAHELVAGCDLWVNLPRPPLEASGTSGMKSALNGGLQLSSLDGWWVEGYDRDNGWAVDGGEVADDVARDAHDAAELYRILEEEVVPQFYDRDADGIPRAWVARMRASLRTLGPRFCAARTLREYMTQVYRPA